MDTKPFELKKFRIPSAIKKFGEAITIFFGLEFTYANLHLFIDFKNTLFGLSYILVKSKTLFSSAAFVCLNIS